GLRGLAPRLLRRGIGLRRLRRGMALRRLRGGRRLGLGLRRQRLRLRLGRLPPGGLAPLRGAVRVVIEARVRAAFAAGTGPVALEATIEETHYLATIRTRPRVSCRPGGGHLK